MNGRSPAAVAADLAAVAQRRLQALRQGDWSEIGAFDEQLTKLQAEWEALTQAGTAAAANEWEQAATHLQAAETATAEAAAWLREAMKQIEADLAAMPLQRQRLAAYLRAGGPAR